MCILPYSCLYKLFSRKTTPLDIESWCRQRTTHLLSCNSQVKKAKQAVVENQSPLVCLLALTLNMNAIGTVSVIIIIIITMLSVQKCCYV